MFGIGWTEILVILAVALLVLGPSKLPEIAKGLGKGIRDFRKAMSSLDSDDEPARPAAWSQPVPTTPPPPPPPPVLPPAAPVEAPTPPEPAVAATPDATPAPAEPVERSDSRAGKA